MRPFLFTVARRAAARRFMHSSSFCTISAPKIAQTLCSISAQNLLTFGAKCGIILVSEGERQNLLAQWCGHRRQTAEPTATVGIVANTVQLGNCKQPIVSSHRGGVQQVGCGSRHSYHRGLWRRGQSLKNPQHQPEPQRAKSGAFGEQRTTTHSM